MRVEGFGGFPVVWMSDKTYQVIKETDHDMLLEEERRLFYVAVTRARDTLYLMTVKGNESQFLEEIPKHLFNPGDPPLGAILEELKTCPECDTQINESYTFCPSCGFKLKFTEKEKQVVLDALEEIPFTPGRNWLSKYLCGKNGDDVQEKHIHGELFGYFEHFSKNTVIALIDQLIEEEKIEKFERNSYPVLKLRDRG
ncbi:MAG TPA: hypothetical protein DCG19_06365 [Cryomorphaceae bacterium]|nr:hypothetical protein [Owenweeksia sp.]MBF97751.1 hypothetical protein [Owenweeksia sp.]HAD97012.1 hypothetical protein [Cryomorphaceae bacterium]HCQ16097.1 hypothetical protein [Cryomorphaceae bacterium]